MKVRALGHVALKVADLRAAEAFYHGVLGLKIAGHMGDDMTFLRAGDDRFQDVTLTRVASDERPRSGLGLDHIALKIGSSLDDIRAAMSDLEHHGIPVVGPVDHEWSVSLYLKDPDGNGVELYVERSDVWSRTDDYTPIAKRIDL